MQNFPEFLENSPVPFGLVKNPYLSELSKGFLPIESKDKICFSFISNGFLFNPEKVINPDFSSSLNYWQENILTGSSWNWSSLEAAETEINFTQNRSNDLFQIINFSGGNQYLFSFEFDCSEPGSYMEVFACSPLGNRIRTLFSANKKGEYQFLFDANNMQGISFSFANDQFLVGGNDFGYLKNVSIKCVDNPFEVCLKTQEDELVDSFGKNFPVELHQQKIYTMVELNFGYLNIPENRYKIYVDFAAIGLDNIEDKGLNAPSNFTPWEKEIQGGNVLYQQFNSSFNQGIKFLLNGTGFPLGIYQESVISKGMKYRIRLKISDKSSNIPQLGIRFRLGGNISEIFEENNQTIECELESGFLDNDFRIYVGSLPIHSGATLHIRDLDIIPLTKKENNSYPIFIKQHWPFTSLIKFRNKKEVQQHIFPLDYYYYVRLEADIIHPEWSSNVDIVTSITGKSVVLRQDVHKKGILAISPIQDVIISIIGLWLYCNDVQIKLPGSQEFIPLIIISKKLSPYYKIGGNFQGINLEVLLS